MSGTDNNTKAKTPNPNFIMSLLLILKWMLFDWTRTINMINIYAEALVDLLKWIFLEKSNKTWNGRIIRGQHERRWRRGKGVRGIWKLVSIFAVVFSGLPLIIVHDDYRWWCTGPVIVVAYVLYKGVLYYGAKLSS